MVAKKTTLRSLKHCLNKSSLLCSTRTVSLLTSCSQSLLLSVKAKHSGNKVTIPGFGTFSTRYRDSRKGIHPAYNKNDGKWNVPNADKLSSKEQAKKEKI